ncbi:hypothetical protein [Krasilnikovia sp. M28-CT-15]|uniref:hypothetical protein n=1 Tax=Krasilnikovia sp. M28-CT-15 TaxID=3373540 RepID=UPI00399D09A9
MTAATAVAVVTATLSVWAVASQARTPAQRAAEAAPPPASELTAVVEEGPLSDSFTVEGRLGRRAQVTVEGPAASTGRSVVTDLPVKLGGRVHNRQLIAVVSGRPLIALEGSFASYRDLHLGDEGPDVRQLRRALGLSGKDTYDRATAASVARLYGAAGYAVPAADPAPAGAEPSPAATGSSSAAGDSTAATAVVRGGLLPMNEVAFLPALPATVVEVNAAVGDKGDQPLVTLASGTWQVVADVNEDERARLTGLPADTRMSISEGQGTGKAVGLAGVKPTKSSEQDEPLYRATFTVPAGSGKGLTEGSPVAIRVIRRTSPPEAVVVPVSALWTKIGGQVEVRVRSAAGVTPVPVTVEFVVDGRAAVTGPDALAQGARVMIGSRNGGSFG